MKLKRLCLLLTGALLLCSCSVASAMERDGAVQEEDSDALRPGQTVVYGKIYEIFGNEMTIKVGTVQSSGSGPGGSGEARPNEAGGETDMPDFPQGQGSDGEVFAEIDAMELRDMGDEDNQGSAPVRDVSPDGASVGESGPPSSGEDRQRSAVNGEGFGEFGGMSQGGEGGTGERPDMGGDAGDGPGSGTVPGGAGGRSGTVSLEYTGEERTYLIPVTATVTANSRTVRFTQLAVKNVVRLVVNEDGTVASVEVIS